MYKILKPITVIIALTGMLLGGCRAGDPAGVVDIPGREEHVSPTATSTIPPSPTATPSPTPEPTATSTPIPLVFTNDPAPLEFLLPPVTQHVMPTGAVVFFELNTPAEGIVVYQPDDEQARQAWVSFDANASRVQATLDNLTPGTTYRARVGIPAGEMIYQQPHFQGAPWGEITFTTPTGERPLRIGVIGDSGFGQPQTFALVEQMAAYNLDFVLHTGDVVYQIYNNVDPFEAYRMKWYEPFGPLLSQVPVYPVVGNHDVEASAMWEDEPFYYRVFPAFADQHISPSPYEGRNMWYGFSYGDVQFLMLDTQVFFNEPGRAEQNAWLAERLADERFSLTIPVFHVPPYTSGLHPYDGVPVRQDWIELFKSAGVRLALSGHDHDYERLLVDDITYIVSGGGSATLYGISERLPESIVFAQQTHFVLLEIGADQIDLQAITAVGDVLDQATISLP